MNRFIVCAYIVITISGCFDPAERDNPLDPGSTGYNPQGKIRGYIGAYYVPQQPVAGATVSLYPSGKSQFSGTDGSFEFNGLPAGQYKLKATQTGYRSDSVEITVNNDIQEIQLQLNAIPVIKKITLQTHHISRWWPSDDLYYLQIATEIEDADGANEIDSAWAEVPVDGSSFPLARVDLNGIFTTSIVSQELSLPSLYHLQGRPIIARCRDFVGNQALSEKVYITRIIEQVPELIFPTGLANINTGPIIFKWETLYLKFPFTLKIEIFQITLGVYNKIYEFSDLPSNANEFKFSQALDEGDYFWVLYIIDEYDDSSRSKEGAFRIIQNIN